VKNKKNIYKSDTQLATIARQNKEASSNVAGFKISIVHDDGDTGFATIMKVSLDARSLKCDLAVNIGRVDDGVTAGKYSASQLLALQAAGFGILNHGWIHEAPADLTTAEIDNRAALEKARFAELEINDAYDYYCYPGVMTTGSLTLKNYLKNIYKCNLCNTGAPDNTFPFDTMEIHRHPLPNTSDNLATVTAYLNDCYKNNEWAVLFAHTSNFTVSTYLDTLLDYIVAQGWTITPVKTVIDQFRNVIELGNKGGSHFYLDENGNVDFSQVNPLISFDDTIRASIADYFTNCVTHQIVEYNTIADMPTIETGTLETYRFANYSTDRYGYQKFRKFNTTDQWFRRWDATGGAWESWVKYDVFTERATKDFEIFDDFIYQTLTAANTPWILNKGTDETAIAPAIAVITERGTARLISGNTTGGLIADNGSQLVCAIPVQADTVGLAVEARLFISNILNISVNFGLTDITTLEEPFEIGASDAITSNASDACCFVFDDGADTKEWFACAVDSDADDTGNSSTGIAPVSGVNQTLRIEVNNTGNTITFYIGGVLVKTLSNAGVTPNVNLYATVVVNSTSTISRYVSLDYISISHNR